MNSFALEKLDGGERHLLLRWEWEVWHSHAPSVRDGNRKKQQTNCFGWGEVTDGAEQIERKSESKGRKTFP